MADEKFHDAKTESLPEWLHARARDASDGQLVVVGATALAALAAMLFWHPPRLRVPVMSAAVGMIAFVAWAMADRELAERESGADTVSRSLRATRALAGAAGWMALLALMVSVLGLGLGTWIS
jgi:hypothetical protein